MTRFILPLLACAALLSAAEKPASAAPPPPAEQFLNVPEPGRFKKLFQPFRTDNAAISPDGKYLAYSLRDSDSVSVAVVEIDNPGRMTAHVKVVDDRAATAMLEADQAEQTPGVIRWMRWVSPTRLAMETNQVFPRADDQGAWRSLRGAVYALNADGSDARLLLKPDDIAESAPTDMKFSVARPPEPTYAGQTPDQSTTDAAAANIFAEAIPEEDEPFFPRNLRVFQGRALRVFDLDPRRTGAVTITSLGGSGQGTRDFGFHSLDTQTGKLTDLTDERVLENLSALIDRQGRIRLTVPDTTLSAFPFRYTYLGPKGHNRATPLDEAAGLTGFTVSPDNFFGHRSIPLGFDENASVLYYASNIGRDTYGIYSLNLATKMRGKLTIENPAFDLIGPPSGGFPGHESLVFDRYTHQLIGVRYSAKLRTAAWLRSDLQTIQARFENTFPGRSVTIHEWDQGGNRYVVSTEGPADPGAFYVYDRTTDKLSEFVRRAPWVEENHSHLTLPFSYRTPDGAHISGLVTGPRQPRLKLIPMVVLCPDLPWQRVRSDFQTEVQALADMGFVVVQLNGRGAWGLGVKQRQSLTTGYDLVQVEDIVTTVTALEKIFPVNLKRVALMGRGHGGFIALRALQTHPDKFRCAIALESPVNLADWLAEQHWTGQEAQPQLTRAWLGDAARLKAAPLSRSPETLTKPVLMLNYPGPNGATRRLSYVAARNFARRVESAGGVIEFADLTVDYMRGLPAARAEVFDRIEAFLNVHIYDFKVKLQELQVIK